MQAIKLSIIVPVYNEKQVIEKTSDKLLAAFQEFHEQIEILFVDDNSPDGTANEVLRVSKSLPQVQLVQHGKKEGIGAAHRAGYESARGEYILCIDADLSQSPDDLLKIKNKLDEGYDLVIGSRYMANGKQFGKSPLRDLGSRGMNLLCRILLGIKLTDCTHTFRGFRKKLFVEFQKKYTQKDTLLFQVEFSFWIASISNKITEIPIHFKEREEGVGVSKISIQKEVPPFLKLLIKLCFKRLFNS